MTENSPLSSIKDLDSYVRQFVIWVGKEAVKEGSSYIPGRTNYLFQKAWGIVKKAGKKGKFMGLLITEGVASPGQLLDVIDVRVRMRVCLCDKESGEYAWYRISAHGQWDSSMGGPSGPINLRAQKAKREWPRLVNAFDTAVMGAARDVERRIHNKIDRIER